jgi:HTH-type transcriptional repressor of NAD biosynthesis genes
MKYEVGIYGGCFNPLHMGHIRCIIKAANCCRELYIILCYAPKRKEIDCRLRYRWLYLLTKHIGNTKILLLEDNTESKADYTNELAIKDGEYIKKQIGKPIDVVFHGSDYGEDSFWRVVYPESQMVSIPRDEISSTQIRENPYKYWEWIPNIVKPYYVKKVLLVGGESTGKSTLTINLANHFNTNYIDEAGREISLRSGTDKMMLQEDYTEILLRHKQNEMDAIKQSNKVLFIDTDALITKFYLEFLDKDVSEQNMVLADAIDGINKYDLILFFEPDVEFVQDGSRNEVISDNRLKYSERIKEILREHNRNFVCICGDYQGRYEKAVEAVERLINVPQGYFAE